MSLSPSVVRHLNSRNIPFDVIAHRHSNTSMQAARSARVTPAQLAKAVVVRYREQHRMCVLPASHQLVVDWIDRDYRGHYQLVNEEDLAVLFPDCETGAVPPLGEAYGMPMVWDNSLRHIPDVYFEAGDHCHLIHMGHSEFMDLMRAGDYATISCEAEMVEFYRHRH